jgi:hypothetical protein
LQQLPVQRQLCSARRGDGRELGARQQVSQKRVGDDQMPVGILGEQAVTAGRPEISPGCRQDKVLTLRVISKLTTARQGL